MKKDEQISLKRELVSKSRSFGVLIGCACCFSFRLS